MPKKMSKRTTRVLGDPCQCTQLAHGHDGQACELPVYGLSRGGKVKLFCDHCGHLNYLKRTLDYSPNKPSARRNEMLMRAGLLSSQIPPSGAGTPTPRPKEIEPTQPEQPTQPPARDTGRAPDIPQLPDLTDEPF